jgi:dynein heavy chain
MVDNVDAKLAESIEISRVYNQREFLVGKELRDYSRLQTMVKEFQPYLNLWRSTRTWFQKHKAWMENKWESLNPEDLETTYENC